MAVFGGAAQVFNRFAVCDGTKPLLPLIYYYFAEYPLQETSTAVDRFRLCVSVSRRCPSTLPPLLSQSYRSTSYMLHLRALVIVVVFVFVPSAETMVFIKGTPDAPRCGFSRTLVGLLREEGISFDSFDILEDQDVRQELKELSNWPTYPQVSYGAFIASSFSVGRVMMS